MPDTVTIHTEATTQVDRDTYPRFTGTPVGISAADLLERFAAGLTPAFITLQVETNTGLPFAATQGRKAQHIVVIASRFIVAIDLQTDPGFRIT